MKYFVKCLAGNLNLITASINHSYFSIGQIGDIYRPIGNSGELKEFAFVGFYNPKHVHDAVRLKNRGTIGKTTVAVEELKSWMLELYPKK